MHRVKIRLTSPELIAEFINICSKYDCDINLYDQRNIIDAKSLIGVFAVTQGKVIEVQAVTADENFISWARTLPYAQELIFIDEVEE